MPVYFRTMFPIGFVSLCFHFWEGLFAKRVVNHFRCSYSVAEQKRWISIVRTLKLSVINSNLREVKWTRNLNNNWSRLTLSFSFLIHISLPLFLSRVGLIKTISLATISFFEWLCFLIQVKPYAEVTAEIEGYLSAHVIKAGVYEDGTIMRVGLPVTLSLQENPFESWCTTMSADLTALELNAGLYYRLCWIIACGSRKTIYGFGTWNAISRNWKLMPTRCSWYAYEWMTGLLLS